MIFFSRRFSGLFWALAAALTLAGCASSGGSPSLFVLDSGQMPATTVHPANAPQVMIDPVSVAPYLDQGGIVYQSAPYRVVIANNNRWAAPLPGALTNDLYSRLITRLHNINLIHATTHHRDVYTVQTQVDEFGGHFDGKAHVAGQWSLVAPNGHTLFTRAFNKQIPLAEDGYPALVASLSKGWHQIADEMAPALQKTVTSQAAR